MNEENADTPEANWLNRHHSRVRIAFRAHNHSAQALAARAGVGVALLPHYIARTEPGLKLCKLEMVPAPREMWLLLRRVDRTNIAVRTVIEYLTHTFEQARELFGS